MGNERLTAPDTDLARAYSKLGSGLLYLGRPCEATSAYERAPLVRAIARALETTTDKSLSSRFFLDLLWIERRLRAARRTPDQLEARPQSSSGRASSGRPSSGIGLAW